VSVLACQHSLADRWEVSTAEPRWLSFAEVLADQGLGISKTQITRFAKNSQLGIFSDPRAVSESLHQALGFMKDWTARVRSTFTYGEQERQLVIQFRGIRNSLDALDVDVGRLVGLDSPSPTFLDDCNVKPQWWATLTWAAIRCRSIGGRLTLRRGPHRSKSRQEYCLEVRFPLDEIPLWENTPSP